VELLKKFVGTPPTELVPGHCSWTDRTYTAACHSCSSNRGVWELLIHWTGSDPAETTWESLPSFVATYPAFELEDALFLGEG